MICKVRYKKREKGEREGGREMDVKRHTSYLGILGLLGSAL